MIELWIRRILWYGLFYWWFMPLFLIVSIAATFITDGRHEVIKEWKEDKFDIGSLKI